MSGTIKKLLIIFFGIFIPALNIKAELGIQNTYQLSQKHFSQAYPATEEKAEPADNGAELPEIILTPGERRKIVLKALTRQANEKDDTQNRILTQYAVKDLDLLNGSTLSPRKSILKNLGQTITVAGEIMLANILITPITDVNILKQRQELIKYLIDNPEAINKIEKHLQHFSENEDGIISLLDPSDTIYKGLFQSLDATRQFGLKPESSDGREGARRFIESMNLFSVGLLPTYFIYYSSKVITQVGFYHYASALAGHPLHMAAGVTLYALTLYLTQRSATQEKTYYSYVMERSRRPGLALFEAKRLWLTLEKHPSFSDVLSSYSEFSKLEYSKELREMLTLLKGSPEQPTTSNLDYYTSHMGRYHKALEVLRIHKTSLLPVIQAVGEIDAWITVAKLVRESQRRKINPITFANYITDNPSPYLRLNQFWNPHLLPENAVPNDMEIGAHQPLNTVITGPNAAGKSTNMEGIAIAVLLAQTFGIAPAQYAEITPFSLIHTHMDISSEVAAGLSTFKAESVRAIELMDHIIQMEKQQFSLTLMDEIFSSTNPIEGEAGTYGYLKIISNNQNAINICTTHYPRLTLLATKY
nr:hypothetical protein [Endozoicomonas sp.]